MYRDVHYLCEEILIIFDKYKDTNNYDELKAIEEKYYEKGTNLIILLDSANINREIRKNLINNIEYHTNLLRILKQIHDPSIPIESINIINKIKDGNKTQLVFDKLDKLIKKIENIPRIEHLHKSKILDSYLIILNDWKS